MNFPIALLVSIIMHNYNEVRKTALFRKQRFTVDVYSAEARKIPRSGRDLLSASCG